ncbi:MAG: thiamine pyrophosphate-dependent enzyme [Patescibacteria group bacterium]|nr:thiamine pyrophosphate-dependent enzyme [Patescibacteria group bacterium]
MDLKTLTQKIKKQNRLVAGHRTCAGCAIPNIIRTVLAACDSDVVVANATSCAEVTSTIYPFTAWNVPWIHNAFENVAATISGVEAAYKSLKKKGQIKKEIKFVAFAGDGGTYDIGLQSLSGALERGHDFLYVCYDNEGYMNTGGQRSSATPRGAATTTTPSGKKCCGKMEFRKNIVEIVAAHGIKYIAQAGPHNWIDLYNKAERALKTPGPTFLNVLSPCTLNWKFPSDMAMEISKLAVETRFWPLYEIINGQYKINYQPSQKIKIEEFLKLQGRFNHLFAKNNQTVIQEIQSEIDQRWQELIFKSQCYEKKS